MKPDLAHRALINAKLKASAAARRGYTEEQMLAAIDGGAFVEALCDKFECEPPSVHRIARMNGRRIASREPAWSDAMTKTLRELWPTGLSASKIGRQIGVSKGATIGKSHRLGLDPRPAAIKQQVELIPAVKEQALKLISLGRSRESVSRELRCSEVAVRRLICRIRTGGAPSPAPKRTVVAVEVVLVSQPISAPPPVAPSGLITRTRTCEWLTGERRRYVACEAPALSGKSYCEDHARLAFLPRRSTREIAA